MVVIVFIFNLDTAYGKNPIDDNWYLFDDSRVSLAKAEDVVVMFI